MESSQKFDFLQEFSSELDFLKESLPKLVLLKEGLATLTTFSGYRKASVSEKQVSVRDRRGTESFFEGSPSYFNNF